MDDILAGAPAQQDGPESPGDAPDVEKEMVRNPPGGMNRITPYVFYDDVPAALDWLERAFGFTARMTFPAPDGRVVHAEMAIGEGVVMLGPSGITPTWKSPRSLGGANSQGLFVYVDDVDAHCAIARAAGARIVKPPADQFWGDRMYSVLDLEGHAWIFAQHLRDVSASELPEAIAGPG